MLPAIRKIAKKSLGAREEAVQDVVTAAFLNFRQLMEKGKDAYAAPLAKFAVKRHKTGRIALVRQNAKDPHHPRCQYLGRSTLFHYGLDENWQNEITAVKRNKGILDQLAFRLDFNEWYGRLNPKDQYIIRDLAMGESMSDIARKHCVSVTTIARFRRKYAESWYEFMGER
jgi:hypothetical protein